MHVIAICMLCAAVDDDMHSLSSTDKDLNPEEVQLTSILLIAMYVKYMHI